MRFILPITLTFKILTKFYVIIQKKNRRETETKKCTPMNVSSLPDKHRLIWTFFRISINVISWCGFQFIGISNSQSVFLSLVKCVVLISCFCFSITEFHVFIPFRRIACAVAKQMSDWNDNHLSSSRREDKKKLQRFQI